MIISKIQAVIYLKLILAFFTLAGGCRGSQPRAFIDGGRGRLDNGTVKIAADKKFGGAIIWASQSGSDKNMINNHDKGRQIQQSYYAGKSLDRKQDGQSESWSPWPWNPVQAGNFDGDRSIVLNFECLEDNTMLYSCCQPRLWDMNEELAKCRLHQWMSFEKGMDNVIRVKNTIECFRGSDDIWGPPQARSQELPAVYAIRSMSKLVIYDGDKPWRNKPLTTVKYGPDDDWIWTRQSPTEPWAACIDPKTGIGLGIYSPETGKTWNMGWVGSAGGGGEFDAATMHFAPLAQWKLGPDSSKSYTYWIIIGKLEVIREKVYNLHFKFNAEDKP
ncbi:hypothetical protein SMSP2_02965 [Limihaloglobus sulfuriphilus]|uniref:Uncharacterized protein n=1 Tax=Limihaloglobus sulfuriphilus TaxID=1851148 RepID=A0A1Q2MIN7_9BACT|nr:hypothetical protein [Limihaloglobus sulfuriphilus]AQQ72575.1 hypothetical protein SMSP2_02965 [Limihaloglobus sulfuriphilus]